MRKSYFGLGVVVGLAAGAVAALLLAPRSGKETREKLRQFKDKHPEWIENTKETSDRLISKTKASIEELLSRLNSFIDRPNGSKARNAVAQMAEEHSHEAA
jgi:gas vesicle protein